MDEHASPPTGLAVAWLGCTLQFNQLLCKSFHVVPIATFYKFICMSHVMGQCFFVGLYGTASVLE